MKKRIGMIGIGSMGKPMAMNLLKAGYPLTVYVRNPLVKKEVADAGVKAAGSIAELAAGAEVVITILPADRHIIEVYTSNGVIDHLPDGAVCLEMTSARGETVQEIAAYAQKKGKKIDFIDAPVSGGVPGAQSGTLTIMVGGERGPIAQNHFATRRSSDRVLRNRRKRVSEPSNKVTVATSDRFLRYWRQPSR